MLYGAGTVGGLVNVTDSKIPTRIPDNGYEGRAGLRYNSGNDEKLETAGVTLALGEQVALRVEGLKRDANNYIAPDYYHEHSHGDHSHLVKERRVDNTFAQSDTASVGLSWIHDRGFTGLSYTNRQDQYGLPDIVMNMKAVKPIYPVGLIYIVVMNIIMMKRDMNTSTVMKRIMIMPVLGLI